MDRSGWSPSLSRLCVAVVRRLAVVSTSTHVPALPEFIDRLTQLVPQGHRLRIRILQAFYSHSCFQAEGQVDWTDLTGDEHDEFAIVSYDPNSELIRYGTVIPDPRVAEYQHIMGQVEATDAARRASVDAAAASRASATVNSKSSSFKKGTKRNVDDYTVFRNEVLWDSWWRGSKATASLHGLEYLWDSTFTVPALLTDDFNLHWKQHVLRS